MMGKPNYWLVTAIIICLVIFTYCTKRYTVDNKDPEEYQTRRNRLSLIHNGLTALNLLPPLITNNNFAVHFHLVLALTTLLHWQYYCNKCTYTRYMEAMDRQHHGSTDKSNGYLWSKAQKVGLNVPPIFFKSMEYIALIVLAFYSFRKLDLKFKDLTVYMAIITVVLLTSCYLHTYAYGI